ncbi:MAG: FAD-dependent oxidoreductase [Hyphomicrobiaceae bacterium]
MLMTTRSITILGAGPTGLSAALALDARGHTVRILERNDANTTESRAVAVNRRSLLHLATVGACEEILATAEILRHVKFFTNGKLLADLDIPQPASGPPSAVALPQSVTEKILAARLQERGVEIEWETEALEVSQTPGEATVRATRPSGEIIITSDFVLGADGSRSITRKSLGVGFHGHRYEGDWSLFDAELDWPWPGVQLVAHLNDPSGIFLMVTLGDGRHRIIGNSLDLEARASKVIPVGKISWRNEFTLSERCVDSFGAGRIWLAGDAAHIHSPVGGMGMNLGIDDAFDFAETIRTGDFAAYDRRRLNAADAVMKRADRGLRLMTSRNPVVRLIRNAAIRIVSASPFIRRRLARAVFASDAQRP